MRNHNVPYRRKAVERVIVDHWFCKELKAKRANEKVDGNIAKQHNLISLKQTNKTLCQQHTRLYGR
jgi:hypothetical protein